MEKKRKQQNLVLERSQAQTVHTTPEDRDSLISQLLIGNPPHLHPANRQKKNTTQTRI